MSSLAPALPLPRWSYASGRPVLRRALLIALALHALLFLLPSRESRDPVSTRPLDVSIDYLPPGVPAPSAEPRPAPAPAPLPQEAIPPPQAQAAPALRALNNSRPEQRAQQRPEQAETLPKITVALLLEQARNPDIFKDTPSPRIPGVPHVPDLPPNLVRPILPLRANAFDDDVISGDREIIDQWIEPNGTINAVVKLPSGDVLCGRAEPWDPMNPLYEPVAMYRSCGGGGKRSASGHSPFLLRD